ncbi:MAG: tRNA pseudouridine synthase 1 [Trizodia sp. TS-e1964]|nr:MAG: tRNA pseudouridine synthase 1 [Trizodia sp. TS-e1964]
MDPQNENTASSTPKMGPPSSATAVEPGQEMSGQKRPYSQLQQGRPGNNERSRPNGRGGKGKKRNMGRGEWSRSSADRRSRNSEDRDAKRLKLEQGAPETADAQATPNDSTTAADANAEARRPKRKVAVLIGYSGSGYRGMQINGSEKTIEGDLFAAFVAVGAISKANADDPKKTSLIRCARTDKGVHAAGNIVSLKLIIEEPDIAEKINAALSPQIRIWGIIRTTGGFSCYQACDSRIYEYLIPTYSFLPPHPKTCLGKQLIEYAALAGDTENFMLRQHDVSTFWETVEELKVAPLLAPLDPSARFAILASLYPQTKAEEAAPTDRPNPATEKQIDETARKIKDIYMAAREAYRISPACLSRIKTLLGAYVGTHNFHNYTVQKTFADPSVKRVIKSFVVDPTPIVRNGTEWLSLKVHGQSFMMHQIRKMVAMCALIVRCGCPDERIYQTYGKDILNVPKAPGLGLLLERPVFESYNERTAPKNNRGTIDFDVYKDIIEEFKQREIYERIFREENVDKQFHKFFTHCDNLPGNSLAYLSSAGISAASKSLAGGSKEDKGAMEVVDPDSDGPGSDGGEG